MDRVTDWASRFLYWMLESLPNMDSVKNWASRFLSGMLESLPNMDSVKNWASRFLSGMLESLRNMDSVKNWLMSLISCLAVKINPIIEEITAYGGKLLKVAGVIVVVYLLCVVIYKCCCGRRGRTMKAPGRNHRIYRYDFERNPKNYFRNLRNNHQD